MSTRVTASARLSTACQQQLRDQLGLSLDPAVELGRLSSIMESGCISLPALQEIISAPAVSSMLGALAPAEFGGVSTLLAAAGNPDPQALAASLQAGLAGAVAVADATVTATARDITASAFAESGLELGYTVSACRAETATGLELRREHEIVLLRVHDGGEVEFDHAGLFDAACGGRQLALEQGAERRGVALTQRNQHYHGAPGGGELIAAAGASGDPSLARATALAAGQPAAQQAPAARRVTGKRRRSRPVQRRNTA